MAWRRAAPRGPATAAGRRTGREGGRSPAPTPRRRARRTRPEPSPRGHPPHGRRQRTRTAHCRGRADRWPAAAPAPPARRARCADSRAGSRPASRTTPPERRPEPWIAHSSEDLPDPLRPIRATISPGATCRSTPRKAATSPYRTTTDRASRPSATSPTVGAGVSGVIPSEAVSQWPGQPPRVAHRERQRVPAAEPAELDDRWRERRGREQVDGAPGPAAVLVDDEQLVGVLHHALEPVLGSEHGDPHVVRPA